MFVRGRLDDEDDLMDFLASAPATTPAVAAPPPAERTTRVRDRSATPETEVGDVEEGQVTVHLL